MLATGSSTKTTMPKNIAVATNPSNEENKTTERNAPARSSM